MKDYASMKKAKIWSVAKKKVVTSPAISEVKDENGIVVRDKQDEMSYDAFNIIKKQFDSATGAELDAIEQSVDVSICDTEIELLSKRITELTSEKEGWEAIKADVEKL